MTCHYPELVPTKVYQDDYDIITDAVCDYMEGPGTEKLVTERYEAVQGEFKSKSQRKKELRKKLKEAFHIEGTKYPRWVQGAEWPMGQNSPMEYLSRSKKGAAVIFTFRDVDTGEIFEVEQFD